MAFYEQLFGAKLVVVCRMFVLVLSKGQEIVDEGGTLTNHVAGDRGAGAIDPEGVLSTAEKVVCTSQTSGRSYMYLGREKLVHAPSARRV